MILLVSEGKPRKLLAIFGSGLIGSAVADRLRNLVPMNKELWPLDWSDSARQQSQLEAITNRMEKVLDREESELKVLWSAGQAGFAASDGETAGELANFTRTLQALEALWKRIPQARGSLVLLSSAGGLFEGQCFVGPETCPEPQRPYGRLKLQQENLLLASPMAAEKIVLRLTSVYGYIRSGQRRGLIPTLIHNGLAQRVSYFFGHMGTLRDFIWVEDVARFLADCMLEKSRTGNRVMILASAKPSSILEIQKLVERTLGHKLYVAFQDQSANNQNITFSPSVLAPGWQSSDLSLTIRKIYNDATGRGMVFS